jgi:hypothetical protein
VNRRGEPTIDPIPFDASFVPPAESFADYGIPGFRWQSLRFVDQTVWRLQLSLWWPIILFGLITGLSWWWSKRRTTLADKKPPQTPAETDTGSQSPIASLRRAA